VLALPDTLRRSIFGYYPTSFLTGAPAVRAYLERDGWIAQNGLTVIWLTRLLLHSCYL
jgi:hypothetical protein